MARIAGRRHVPVVQRSCDSRHRGRPPCADGLPRRSRSGVRLLCAARPWLRKRAGAPGTAVRRRRVLNAVARRERWVSGRRLPRLSPVRPRAAYPAGRPECSLVEGQDCRHAAVLALKHRCKWPRTSPSKPICRRISAPCGSGSTAVVGRPQSTRSGCPPVGRSAIACPNAVPFVARISGLGLPGTFIARFALRRRISISDRAANCVVAPAKYGLRQEATQCVAVVPRYFNSGRIRC